MKIYFHDNTPAGPGEIHGIDGPTHAGTVSVDYEYQVEMWVVDAEKTELKCFRIRCPMLQREWKRDDTGKMIEVSWDPTPPVIVGIVPPSKG